MTKNNPIYHVEDLVIRWKGRGITETFPSIYVPSVINRLYLCDSFMKLLFCHCIINYDNYDKSNTFKRHSYTHKCRGVYSFRLSVRPFVRTYVRSYFRPVRGITSKFYVQATRVENISPTTHQKAFIFGP